MRLRIDRDGAKPDARWCQGLREPSSLDAGVRPRPCVIDVIRVRLDHGECAKSAKIVAGGEPYREVAVGRINRPVTPFAIALATNSATGARMRAPR